MEKFVVDDLVLFLDYDLARRADKPLGLTHKEYAILKFLMQHPNEVMSRDVILDAVWDIDTATSSMLDVHICTLRKKLGEPSPIKTVRGSRDGGAVGGYKFVVTSTEAK